jgi:hypothetical protein
MLLVHRLQKGLKKPHIQSNCLIRNDPASKDYHASMMINSNESHEW